MLKQCSIVLKNHVQLAGFRMLVKEISEKYRLAGIIYNDRDGSVKFLCEGKKGGIADFVDELKRIKPEIEIEISDKLLLPKTVARAVTGLEAEIFDRLDVGVKHLSSLDKKQDKMIGLQEEGVDILREIASTLEGK
jgi:acylphosphatase